MEIDLQIQRAYKKLKASVYFDKTQLVLRNNIVEFEGGLEDVDARLVEIADILTSENSTDWDSYVKELLKCIKVLTLPKSISSKSDDKFILNDNPTEIDIEQAQYFIDMNVEGQILGILWVLTIGAMLDDEIYQHSYGNRLKSNLLNEETENTTFSPYLFKPYFEQYEGWRDIGLKYAESCLDEKQDVLILTMDLKRYFYSVNFTETQFEDFYDSYSERQWEIDESELLAVERINQFVFRVMKQFSSYIPEYNENVFLPIGFFPSNILSNWYLNKFDSSISDRWNPVYYGRYVDDIIIVEKVEKNSYLYKQAHENILTQEKVIDFFLCNCSSNRSKKCDKNIGLLMLLPEKDENEEPIYKINSAVLKDEKANIIVQNDKVKVFYFKANSSKAILSCFRNELNKNKSEFRYLPEDEAILQEYDYSEIFDLNKSDTINKFRGIKGIAINKFNLSKFLGKYLRIGGLINDKKETRFERDILTIFDTQTIIENYIVWERVIEILVLSNNFDLTYKFIEKIMTAIENVKFTKKTKSKKVLTMKITLLLFLHAAISRAFSLNWNVKIKEIMDKINRLSEKAIPELKSVGLIFDYEYVCQCRQNYCLTRMNDKYVMPALIDAVLGSKTMVTFNDDLNLNLSDFGSFLNVSNNLDFQQSDYKYYPFIISLQDIEIGLFLSYMVKSSDNRPKDEVFKMVKALYLKLNYLLEENSNHRMKNIDVSKMVIKKCTSEINLYATISNNDKKDYKGKYKIAIANAKLNEHDFVKVLTDSPDRSYNRYKKLVKIVNQAIEEKADILVMPEAYIPFEWLSILARTSAKNQMAIITGIEHTNYKKEIRNLTATILSYMEDEYKFAHINIHNKTHYSPDEVRIIKGYCCNYEEGDSYDLFNWNDLWFSVYCCFELSSIQDRSLFQSYADATIAVEWNHDTNYYSNIIESLGRDLHCYCIQVNTSDYGDSRIVSPTKTELKDIVRTKGGNNDTVLVSDIDVYALRNFQIKGYELQKDDKSFKPTPPDFSTDIVKKKIKRRLWRNFE